MTASKVEEGRGSFSRSPSSKFGSKLASKLVSKVASKFVSNL